MQMEQNKKQKRVRSNEESSLITNLTNINGIPLISFNQKSAPTNTQAEAKLIVKKQNYISRNIRSQIPKFLSECYRLDLFLSSLKQSFLIYKNFISEPKEEPLTIPLNFLNGLELVLNSINICLHQVDFLCGSIFSVLKSKNPKNLKEDYLKERDQSWDYLKIVIFLKNCIGNCNIDDNIIVRSHLPHAIQTLRNKVFDMYNDIRQCSLNIFTDAVFREAKNQEKTEIYIPGNCLLFFIELERFAYKNIYTIFEDMEAFSILKQTGYDESLLMPGVFYEYYIFNKIGKFSYQLDEGSIPFRLQAVLKDFIGDNCIIDIFEKKDENGNIKNYLQFDNIIKEIFPRFKIKINRQGLPYEILFDNHTTIVYHPKTTGNVSKGFWVSSKKIFFFKELYCVSEVFQIEKSKIMEIYESQLVSDYGTNIRKMNYNYFLVNTEPKVSKEPHKLLNAYHYSRYDVSNYASISSISDIISNTKIFHLNEYVELSGYFLMEMFGLAPKIESFYSDFCCKPIIKVEEVNTMKFMLVSNIDNNGEENRYDFNYINNDKFALFMSAIPIQSLRLIQLIFLIDDFHEGNVAISVVKKMENNFYIEYIDKIIVIDIWPSRIKIKTGHLFTRLDLHHKYSDCSFDDIILSRLDFAHVNKYNENMYQDKNGKVIDILNEEETFLISDTIDHIENRRIFLDNLEPIDQIRIYGNRICGIKALSNYNTIRRIITIYAMIDLFDEYFYKNHEVFSSIHLGQSNICANIAMTMLKEAYSKCTKETDTLLDIYKFYESEQPSLEELLTSKPKNRWIQYLTYVTKTINKLFIKELYYLPETEMILPEIYQLTSKVNDHGKNVYDVVTISHAKKLLFSKEKCFGFAFLNGNSTTENAINLFGFKEDYYDQKAIFENYQIAKGQNPSFFYTCSPVLFDILKVDIDSDYLLESEVYEMKNLYFKGIKKRPTLFRTK